MTYTKSGSSGKLVVELDYCPLPDEDPPEQIMILGVSPHCLGCPGTDGRLCDSCWFREFVNTIGMETVMEDASWAGRGEDEATLRLTGNMVFEETTSVDYGWDCDENFEIDSVEVLPPGHGEPS